MIPGTILCDDEFTFSDGTKGQKLSVVLNDGQSGAYVVIKTTSNPNFKGTTYGCQSSDRYPNFFCPKGSCCLKKDTWIQLDQFFEFMAHELVARHFTGHIKRIGVLPDQILKELLECAINCEDITQDQIQVLSDCLTQLATAEKTKNTGSSADPQ
jgi:hypothetical protein